MEFKVENDYRDDSLLNRACISLAPLLEHIENNLLNEGVNPESIDKSTTTFILAEVTNYITSAAFRSLEPLHLMQSA